MKENRLKPWIILVTVCLMSASNLGLLLNSLGVFYSPVSEALGVKRAALTLFVTIGSIVSAIMALFIARLMKKYNFKIIILIGALLSGGATFLMGSCTQLSQFYILGAIRGLGLQFFSMLVLTMIINNWFVGKHGLATSIVMSFGGIAGAIGSPLLTSFITNLGWENAFRLYGIIAFALCLPVILYPFKLNPRDEGLLPYGYTEKNETITEKKDGSKVKFLPFIAFAITTIFIIGLAAMPQQFPGYAVSIGYTASVGALMLSASMMGNISSKILFGILSDKIGAFYTSTTILAINLFSIVILLFLTNQTALIAGAFLFGAIYSMNAVGNVLLCKEFFGLENYTKVYSKITFATGIAGAFATTLYSSVYDIAHSYTPAFIMLIGFHAAIFLSLLFLSSKRKKGEIG